MSSDQDTYLLKEAIMYIRSKEYDAARRFLERALAVVDDMETRERIHFYLSQVTDDPVEKRKHLDETLAFNPGHGEAARELAILDGKLKPSEIVDPDRLPAQSTETQNTKADRFTCPKCGSRMIFDGDGRSLICESCARTEGLKNGNLNEQNFLVAMATGQGHRAPVAMKTFQCQGCGVQFVLPPQVISENCSYCGSVYVLIGTRELIEADSIVPMAFNQREAARRLVEWVRRHKIKPQGKVQAPRGLYLPVWTFDIMGTMPWRGFIQRDKQRIPVSSEKIISADDLVVYSTPKLADLLPKVMHDFVLTDGTAYDPRYLAGWPAEIYQKTLADASLDARQWIIDETRKSIRVENGEVRDLSYSLAKMSILSFKLVLVPVWVTEYKVEDHPYRVIINGQTGSVYGERASRGVAGWLGDLLGGE